MTETAEVKNTLVDGVAENGGLSVPGAGDAVAATDDRKIEPLTSNKRDRPHSEGPAQTDSPTKRQKGVAPIKAEFLLHPNGDRADQARRGAEADDAAEAADSRYQKTDSRDNNQGGRGRKKDNKKTPKSQNTSRSFGFSSDKLHLCSSRQSTPEFSPRECQFGAKCKFEHDLRKYLSEGKRENLPAWNGLCPIFEARGYCNLGWKCRFHLSHSEERATEDGKKELVLIEDAERKAKDLETTGPGGDISIVNAVPKESKINLSRRKTGTPKSDQYIEWVNANAELERSLFDGRAKENNDDDIPDDDAATKKEDRDDIRARFVEAPFRPSEKRRIYYGPETPVLAPLTTQGNLPYRRLCVELGAQVTWSEMAMGMPLVQGENSEWALIKAHESEATSPKFLSKGTVVQGYDNARDIKFGAQIAANKPWLATKTVEVLTSLCPSLRAIDLNCGCPINLVCEKGAGSALLDSPSKLENTLRGMNYVSNDVPITVKIRMGTRDGQPTAHKLAKRLVLGGREAIEAGKGTAGVAAITLHGRSKQQRYTRSADWGYIAECSALINRLKREQDDQTDTIAEADPRDVANEGHVYFVGNGDCYSHVDYYSHIENAKVDSVMVARGALIKPWIFEEIETGQYLDKTGTERLAYVEKFAKYGLQNWGSDEMGIGLTRRFLLEWLSFSCRYVPIGLLEHLPPNIQDRPPAFKGRDELETLLSSDNYKDWIKISEMFLGPAHPNFKFEPKHKSNSYDSLNAEG
ncbi:tRNA-dihydrouridine(47) synthase [NAD(P)(+)] [Massariosphaeria phaeospora]|uniref:tRNA-dihydrouridine(47) synthase [NAD(P)(+)] n=1 Tax=Massariosphaeria phaeospora TaxID=100035 RepID=A0A7C8M3R3_9PLEO|nr:tRNA-dihydrouridine(47) synthase [NAD(P)(+)] [Massariosphaeria phaeospora]